MQFSEYFEALRGKHVAVVGLGVSNLPLIGLLSDYGCDVTGCDKRSEQELGALYEDLTKKGVKLQLGEGYLDNLDFDVIFRTPGLHPMALDAARKNGAVITSEMEAFFALCPCRVIAVTGSDGKTTTTTLIAEMLKKQGKRVHLGGNIGKPLLSEIPDLRAEDFAVLELSSFQLHSMTCRPDVAVVTNVSPNHLDVHPSYEDYIEAKKSIFRLQDDNCRLVLNRDNDITRAFATESKAPVTWFSRREVLDQGWSGTDGVITRGGKDFLPISEILIPGMHNVENMMAAFAAVDGIVDADNCRAVAREFPGVEHRIELVRTLRGVRYYNDSIASSPTRAIAGRRSFPQKVILIAGGHDKHVPFDPLAEEVVKSVKALFLTGETAEKIKAAVESAKGYDKNELPVFVIDDFKEAVLAASNYAREGDVVTLSPACSSFDKFKNFVERGNVFKEIVNTLE